MRCRACLGRSEGGGLRAAAVVGLICLAGCRRRRRQPDGASGREPANPVLGTLVWSSGRQQPLCLASGGGPLLLGRKPIQASATRGSASSGDTLQSLHSVSRWCLFIFALSETDCASNFGSPGAGGGSKLGLSAGGGREVSPPRNLCISLRYSEDTAAL